MHSGRMRGLIARSLIVSSKTSDLVSDFDRCSRSCRVREIVFRWFVRTERTPKRRIEFSTMIVLARQRFWRGTFRRRMSVFRRPSALSQLVATGSTGSLSPVFQSTRARGRSKCSTGTHSVRRSRRSMQSSSPVVVPSSRSSVPPSGS